MGSTICKPKKKLVKGDYQIHVNKNSNADKNSDEKLKDHSEKILYIVNELFATYKDSESDVIGKSLLSRAKGKKRPIQKNEDINIQAKYPKCGSFKDILKVFSMDELIEFLDRCSNSTESPSAIDDLEIEPSPTSPHEIVMNGSIRRIKEMKQIDMESLLKDDKIHLDLASNKDSITKLITVLNMAAQFHILDEILSIENDERNNVTSIAFLNSNIRGFYYLIKKHKAEIPMYIYKESHRYNFLNYIAQHGKMPEVSKEIDFPLLNVLNIIKEDYSEDKIKDYLYDTDEQGLDLSLPHLLLHMYQNSVDLREDINKCLKICLEACPTCIEVLCVSKFCTAYRFDLIAHAIILPETNFGAIEMLMDLNLSQSEIMAYRDLINVHEASIQKNRLLQIFSVPEL